MFSGTDGSHVPVIANMFSGTDGSNVPVIANMFSGTDGSVQTASWLPLNTRHHS